MAQEKDWLEHDLLKTIRDLKEKHNPYLVYIIFIYILSVPLILVPINIYDGLFILCLVGFAILVPYVIFKEKKFKLIAVSGIVALLLLGLTSATYQVEGVYLNSEPEELSSDYLTSGSIDRIHGEQDESFTFTVIIAQEAYEELIMDRNYTVELNLRHYDEGEEVIEVHEMNFIEDPQVVGKKYSIEISDWEKSLYLHSFSLNVEKKDEDYNEETDSGYGPLTMKRMDLYMITMSREVTTSFILFFIFLGLFWWRTRMLKKHEELLNENKKKKEDSPK
ncbi:MAG: hypothetical protein ACOC87_02800 [Candidatus Natronoplasma sp.]